MLYNVVLVSTTQQCESAISTRIPPLLNLLSTPPSHPSRLSQSTRVEFPVLYSNFPLANYFTYGNVYVPEPFLNRQICLFEKLTYCPYFAGFMIGPLTILEY